MLLVVYRVLGVREDDGTERDLVGRLGHGFKMFVFFQLVCVSWLFFRAESIDQVYFMIGQIFTDPVFTSFSLFGLSMIVFFAAPMMAFEYWTERSRNLLVLLDARPVIQVLFYLYLIIMMIVFPPLISQEFIYFQF
jgi:hypothetical protein